MPLLELSEDLRTNIKEIDEQHINLLKIVSAVHGLKKKDELSRSADKVTFTLLSFAKYHFRTEETWMEKNGYPEYEPHKEQHARLIDEITRVHEANEAGENVDFYEIHDFLVNWFLNHTRKCDTKLAGYISKTTREARKTPHGASTSHKRKPLSIGQSALLEWDESFNLGIPDIDKQHMDLLCAVNMLYSTLGKPMQKSAKDTVEEAFKELKKYVGQHFNREEGLMEKCGYPDLIIHSMEHEKFRQQIRMAKKRFDKYRTVVDPDFVVILRDWFTDHIQNDDKRYVGHLKSDN